MDGALWLLLRLRLGGFLRRWSRSLGTVKGLLLALVGSLLYLPMIVSSVFAPRFQLTAQLALVRRHGALGLFAFCLLNLILTSDERAIYFTPAEVEFLFTGPFRRRQLLLYKMVSGLFSSLLVALLMTFLFAHHANSFLCAFAGLFLMIELMVLLAMAVGLLVSTVGAFAFNRQRKVLLAAVAGLAIAVLLPWGRDAFAGGEIDLLDRLEGSAVLRVVTWPFRPPVMAFTSEGFWPDLAGWSLLGLVVLATLAIAVLALDAEYYEATAAASARTYARVRARSLGQTMARSVRTRIALPMLPWWGGIGPNLWRQLATAVRFPGRFFMIMLFHLAPLLPLFWGPLLEGPRGVKAPDLSFIVIILASFSLASSMLTGFDFRSDLDRMDTLKTIPISAPALAISQLVVPTIVLTLAQAACLGVLAGLRDDATYLLAALFFLPPYNALLVETEAILFLWFPNRIVPGSSMDFSIIGRQILLMFAKLLVIGFTGGLASGIGALFYSFLVPSWPATLVLVWLLVAGFVVALIPLIVVAFDQFDVARDAPP